MATPKENCTLALDFKDMIKFRPRVKFIFTAARAAYLSNVALFHFTMRAHVPLALDFHNQGLCYENRPQDRGNPARPIIKFNGSGKFDAGNYSIISEFTILYLRPELKML